MDLIVLVWLYVKEIKMRQKAMKTNLRIISLKNTIIGIIIIKSLKKKKIFIKNTLVK